MANNRNLIAPSINLSPSFKVEALVRETAEVLSTVSSLSVVPFVHGR
ncbi:MAG: hypothetical protein PUP91_20600 [Rhizonema sp. PD37]|nr:hypothetical protein [Rhizonema sp. PD37]